MAEELPQIDPVKEGRRITSIYLNELGWARDRKRMVTRQVITGVDREMKMHEADNIELSADEQFGAAVDKWRAEKSKVSREVLSEILRMLEKRRDISVLGKRMVSRIKEDILF